MGGIKIYKDDFLYKAMLVWLQDFAHQWRLNPLSGADYNHPNQIS
jgi:hypothetical protein